MYHSNKFSTTNTVLRRRNYCYVDNLAQSGIESREIFTINHVKGKVSCNKEFRLKLLTTKIELENLMLNSTFLIFFLPCYSPSNRSFPLLSKVAFRIFIHNPTCLCHNFFSLQTIAPFLQGQLTIYSQNTRSLLLAILNIYCLVQKTFLVNNLLGSFQTASI